MIGLFINTLPVVDHAHPQQKIGAWLRELQERNLALREHGWKPLADIQRLAGRAGRPLFDNILVFENYPVDQVLRTKHGQLSASRTQILETSNYPLFVSVGLDGQLRLVFNFQRQHFDEKQIRRLQAAFVQLLATISRDAGQTVAGLVADDAGDLAMLARANDTARAIAFASLVAQFEAQAARRGDAIALIHGDETISYGELNARANRLASRLRTHGIGTDVVVGLALERSITTMVALLAVLKAGGAYLPLDPDYPAERLAHMLGDSGAKLLLTQAALLDRFAPALRTSGAEAWLLDTESGDGDDANLDLEIHPESLAYVIYTSGSTGIPKGVACTRGALAARLAWMQAEYALAPGETLLQKTPFSFDVSVWEFFWPLLAGARLVMARPEGHKDPAYLVEVIRRERITTLHFVPSMLQIFVEYAEAGSCTSVKRVMCSGEALPPVLAARLLERLEGTELHNLYGPTEAAV
ncbi:MAG: AMP-binding protein, partial [Staphylococcus epidermidis]|nr:AMP-binding protein [Staphylococcus epidermidis]